MLRHILRRLLLAIPTLLAVFTVIFVIMRVAPGDPATAARSSSRIAASGSRSSRS